jgi:hypothetical protein
VAGGFAYRFEWRTLKDMKIKTLFATLLTPALFTAGYARAPDKAKLDQSFDRLAEKNMAMGSLTIARDGNVLYTRTIGYSRTKFWRRSGEERGVLTGRLSPEPHRRTAEFNSRRSRKGVEAPLGATPPPDNDTPRPPTRELPSYRNEVATKRARPEVTILLS